MKRGSFHLQLASLISLGFFLSTPSAWSFSGVGDGTEISPYIITDVTQLQEMSLDLSAHYVLGNDIDASETVNWNGGEGFEPIGNYFNQFVGIFNGQDFKVTGLFIDRVATDHVGLFGVIAEATVQNVLTNATHVNGRYMVGGLIGFCSSSNEVDECHVSGSVSGTSLVGGLVGWSHDTRISKCSSRTQVSGLNSRIGGLVGLTSNASQIIDSHADCTVTGNFCVGALVGINAFELLDDNSTIVRCYSAGMVIGTLFSIGGLVGQNAEGSIVDCYSSCDVLGATDIGGLVGINLRTVDNSFSNGSVSGDERVGGLIGSSHSGGITNSYWDTQTSGQSISSGGSGKTTAEMYQQATFEGWDFDSIWSNDEGNDYPRLLWERGKPHDLLRMIEGFHEGRANGNSFLDYTRFWGR